VAKRQAKRRTTRRTTSPPVKAAQPKPSVFAAPPREQAIRLPRHLSRRDSIAVAVVAVTGIAAFADVVEGFDFYEANPFVAVVMTFIILGAIFAIERRALMQTARSSIRFAGVGVVAPLMWWIVPLGAMTPIGVMQGYTTYRLGLGSVFGPAFVGAILTGSIFGATPGLMAATASGFGGIAALMFTREGP
jgi:hypothetical protein